jgi:hypothetical protein
MVVDTFGYPPDRKASKQAARSLTELILPRRCPAADTGGAHQTVTVLRQSRLLFGRQVWIQGGGQTVWPAQRVRRFREFPLRQGRGRKETKPGQGQSGKSEGSVPQGFGASVVLHARMQGRQSQWVGGNRGQSKTPRDERRSHAQMPEFGDPRPRFRPCRAIPFPARRQQRKGIERFLFPTAAARFRLPRHTDMPARGLRNAGMR